MPLDGMIRRARNVVIANNDFIRKSGTVLTSPTAFVPGMGLSNITNDRLKMVCRTIGNSIVLDLDMGYPVPASLIMLLGHNLTAAAKWRIRGASARSGTASDPGGYSFSLADTVYDTRSVLATGTARGAYSWTGTMLDHDFTTGTLPSGASFSRGSIGTYFDYTGTLRTAAAGEPRFDYDPATKTARGILIEEERANLLAHSAALATAPWFSGGLTSIADNTGDLLAPDGLATATKIVATGSGSAVGQGAMLTAAQHTGSVWLRAASGTMNLSLIIYLAVSPFTLIGNASITVTTSWQRFSVTSSAATAATYNFQIQTIPSGTLYAWGAQLEMGTSPTSYIPTASVAVTRSADVLTMPTSALPSFNAAEGTMIATFAMPYLGSGGYPGVAFLDDGTLNNSLGIFIADASTDDLAFEVHYGGLAIASMAQGVYPAGATKIAAAAWKATSFAFSASGGIATSSAATVPPVTTLRVGNLRGALGPLNGWISRLTYIASRISNADLQTLTNPATSADTRAATLAPYAGTSGTAPVTLGMGSQTVYVDDAGLRFYRGTSVRLAIDATRYMSGTVTAYDRPSRRLTVNITAVVGGGSAATVTILREASDLSVWPSVEPFGVSYWGAFTWGGQIDLLGEGYQPPGVHLPGLTNGDGQPIYARYFKIEVQDTSLSWLDIGRLVVAAAYQPTINMAWDWRLSWVDPSTRERSRGGQLYVDGRRQWRAASLSLANIGRDEMLSQMYELRRAVGVRKPFALILDPTDPVNLHRLTLWGSMPDQTVDFSNPQYGDYRTTLTVEESF